MVLSGLSQATAQRDTKDRRAGAGQGLRAACALFFIICEEQTEAFGLSLGV